MIKTVVVTAITRQDYDVKVEAENSFGPAVEFTVTYEQAKNIYVGKPYTVTIEEA